MSKLVGFFRLDHSSRTLAYWEWIFVSVPKPINVQNISEWMDPEKTNSSVTLKNSDFFCTMSQFLEDTTSCWQLPLTSGEFIRKSTYMHMCIRVCTRVHIQLWSLYCITVWRFLLYLQLLWDVFHFQGFTFKSKGSFSLLISSRIQCSTSDKH